MKILFLFSLLILQLITTNIYPQKLQWRTIVNGPHASGRFDDVFFINANTGWIVGAEGRVIKTTDGGFNWITQGAFTGRYLRAIGFSDSLNGWMGLLRYTQQHPDEILYRTTNGGANWYLVDNIPQPQYNGICGISVVNSSVVYASGSISTPAVFLKTTNGGTNWELRRMTEYAGFLVDCYFKNENTGFVVGCSDSNINIGKPVVLYTTNAGTNWTITYTGSRAREWGWKINFISSSVGYVSIEKIGSSGGSPIYIKTTDGGLTWTEKPFLTQSYNEQGIGFINENTGWIGGWGGPTYQTTNAGANWELAGFGRYINRFRFLNDSLAYAVGEDVYKYSTENVINISSLSNSIPSEFKLTQNYPNPFNPSTTIKYELYKPSKVKLEIYDMSGRVVKTLYNDFLPSGSYEMQWNGLDNNERQVSSGVYFYKLETQYFSEVKKMALVK
jgi:photosystem II stability/assembly factor-like uncharacterized protein